MKLRPADCLVGFLLSVALAQFSSSSLAANTLRLHPPDTHQLDFPALSLIVEEETGIRLEADPSNEQGDDPLASLLDGSADLAIVENTRRFEPGVRTVLPLYRSVLHLAARQGLRVTEFAGGERLPRVQIVNQSHTGRLVADLLFERAEVLPDQFEVWNTGDPGEPDLIIYLGPINPRWRGWLPEGFSLVSVSRFDAAGAEFYIDGISYLVPQLQPTRIPALTYRMPGNEEGIDTLAVDMLLVTNRDTDSRAIYALTQALLEQKARFAAVDPALFRWLRSDFSDTDFAFPLHRGARQYFSRDEPGFLERYAEALNFIVYLSALSVTGLIGFGRWRARRRKDRIDSFYLRVLALRRESAFADPVEQLSVLENIEEEAFAGLVAEKLSADDSFRIFAELAEGLRAELKNRINARGI